MSRTTRANGGHVNARYIDWIWNVRGRLVLAPGQTCEDAFGRLDPLFHEYGTTHVCTRDTLTFSKKDQSAQDRMSIFDHGVLRLEKGPTGTVLSYRLVSRALLFCFLAPLLFLAFAQLSIAVSKLESASAAAPGKDREAERKDKVLLQNPIDKVLGAPAPEAPKKDGVDKDKQKDKKLSPTPAYVFAVLFALLYVVGRVLEDRMVSRLFASRLHDAPLQG